MNGLVVDITTRYATSPFGTAQTMPPHLHPLATVPITALPDAQNVRIVDSAGRPVTNIDDSEVQVLEDGVPQRITTFTPSPPAVTLLFDTSQSMRQQPLVAQKAAPKFIRLLVNSNMMIAISGFDDTLYPVQPFTSDQGLLEAGISNLQIFPGSMTALYAALSKALDTLRADSTRTPARWKRPDRWHALVVFIDGRNEGTSSGHVTFKDVLDKAARPKSPTIYTICPRDGPSGCSGDDLKALARVTGGQAFDSNSKELHDIYSQIATELSGWYYLAYTPSNQQRDGGWRSVEVRVPGRQVRTRTNLAAFDTHAQSQTFNLFVFASDENDMPMRDLEAADLSVTEGGAKAT
jgi:VWFA-related protein